MEIMKNLDTHEDAHCSLTQDDKDDGERPKWVTTGTRGAAPHRPRAAPGPQVSGTVPVSLDYLFIFEKGR